MRARLGYTSFATLTPFLTNTLVKTSTLVNYSIALRRLRRCRHREAHGVVKRIMGTGCAGYLY
eukprot:2530925-Pleurochrysis_carterae.AAC.1